MKRKILYSPGFGAGWSSWENNKELAKFMLTYQPFIDFLETGNNFESYPSNDLQHKQYLEKYPIVAQFLQECQEKFNDEPYLGGISDLQVAIVSGRVRIHEYDGNESYEEENKYDNWM